MALESNISNEKQKDTVEAAPIKKRRRLTAKQEGFVKDFLETKNASEAIRRNYKVSNNIVAGSMAKENLHKPAIRAMIEDMKARYVQDSYEMYERQKAIALNTKNEYLANKIFDKIQDRAGFVPVAKSEQRKIEAKYVFKRQ